MSTQRYTPKQIIEAIQGTGGIKAIIARRLGCTRHTVDNYLARYATVQKAYEEERETVGDMAEANVHNDIRNHNVDTSKWYLVMKHPDRGYGQRKSTHESEIDISEDRRKISIIEVIKDYGPDGPPSADDAG